MRINREELADVFDVSANTITAWLRDGLPVVKRGGRGRGYVFDTGDVHHWLVERAIGQAVALPAASEGTPLDAARLRKLNADAEMAENRLAEQGGRLVRIEAVSDALDKVLGTVRAKLLGLPTRLAVKLAAARSRDAARALLDDGLNNALAELQVEAIARREALRTKIEDEDDDELTA